LSIRPSRPSVVGRLDDAQPSNRTRSTKLGNPSGNVVKPSAEEGIGAITHCIALGEFGCAQSADVDALGIQFAVMTDQPALELAIACFGMKLTGQDLGTGTKGLISANGSGGKTFGAIRQIKCFAVPV